MRGTPSIDPRERGISSYCDRVWSVGRCRCQLSHRVKFLQGLATNTQPVAPHDHTLFFSFFSLYLPFSIFSLPLRTINFCRDIDRVLEEFERYHFLSKSRIYSTPPSKKKREGGGGENTCAYSGAAHEG